MLPILWRYLASSFLRVFLLSVLSFVAVLLVIRLEEIARFASAGAPWGVVILFALYQIPYILPIAIPISCLIAALLFFHEMSSSQELTSLRAAGLSLGQLSAPILFVSMLLCIGNFVISAEVAPYIRSLSKELILKVAAGNPLVILQKDALIKFKKAFVDMRTSSSPGKASDVLFISKNTSSGKLGLMVAKELNVHKGDLRGKQVSFISSLDPKAPNRFDHLIIENQNEMDTAAAGLSQFWEDAQWQLHADYLPLRLLLAREKVGHDGLFTRIGKAHVEFARRFSLGLATITFTLIGLSFGMQIGRQPSKKAIGWAIVIATTFLVMFTTAKSLKTMHTAAFFLYILPHPFIALYCIRVFRRNGKGIEA